MGGVVGGILLVAFIIICVLLILMVVVQDEDNNGMGGMLGGGNSAAFGSRSSNVLIKTTGVMTVLFFVFAFSLGIVHKGNAPKSSLGEAAKQLQTTDAVAPAENSETKKAETPYWQKSNETETTTTETVTPSEAAESEGTTETVTGGEEKNN